VEHVEVEPAPDRDVGDGPALLAAGVERLAH
jgi:hypothetical protein